MPAVQLLIKGKVQGVFFRMTAKGTAEKQGLTGWIRNTEAGHVEAVVQGTPDAINLFTKWCRQGPPGAVVTGVDVTETSEQFFDGFRVIRS